MAEGQNRKQTAIGWFVLGALAGLIAGLIIGAWQARRADNRPSTRPKQIEIWDTSKSKIFVEVPKGDILYYQIEELETQPSYWLPPEGTSRGTLDFLSTCNLVGPVLNEHDFQVICELYDLTNQQGFRVVTNFDCRSRTTDYGLLTVRPPRGRSDSKKKIDVLIRCVY